MTATAAVRQQHEDAPDLPRIHTHIVESLSSQRPLSANEFAGFVETVVAWADEPIDPALIAPVALILREEGMMALPEVTFGCNYSLDVLSFELSRGFTRAIDLGTLVIKAHRVVIGRRGSEAQASPNAQRRARELFELTRNQLMAAARHHLLRDRAA